MFVAIKDVTSASPVFTWALSENFSFHSYVLPGVFDNMFWQEGAARVLAPSVLIKQIVGTSKSDLVRRMNEDIAQEELYSNYTRDFLQGKAVYLQRVRAWRRRRRFSLGLVAWLASAPVPPPDPVRLGPPLPESLVYRHGPEPILRAIHELVGAGWLEQQVAVEDEILFPSLSLIKRLQRAR